MLQLIPEYREYVWGGQRLRPGIHTAEAWLVYEGNRVAAGPYAGQTLAELTTQLGAGLVGRPLDRFPLLIKVLDCADWLSVQVHPNDAQAQALEGPGQLGKTEAWHVLAADPGARIIAGVAPDTAPDRVADAIRRGTVLDVVEYHTVDAGDTVYMPAGTLHALGPGLLIYEVQQTSNLTYRVFDWNRPATQNRPLHREQSLAVTDPRAHGRITRAAPGPDAAQILLDCPYFCLERLPLIRGTLAGDTYQHTFHALTVIEGTVEITSHTERLRLGRLETVIIPADEGRYQLQAAEPAVLLRASLPSGG